MANTLHIVADENIPYADEYFSHLGTVKKVHGRSLCAEQVAQADVLLVRSVSQVNEALLNNSAVKFVGTATIGVDHLDTAYLDRKQISWANAPACNAHSVVDYVFSCISQFAGLWQQLLMDGHSVGIIGLGNVGSRLQQRLLALGIKTKAYDPLLSDTSLPLDQLEQVLACDVVCMHAPLTNSGPYPSYHMIGMTQLQQLKPQAVLINAGRGAVVDNQQLLSFLQQRPQQRVVLDVWENEPQIDLPLLPAIAMASPHIAGYSLDGKILGTAMIYQSCCKALAIAPKPLANEQPLIPFEIPAHLTAIAGLSYAIKQVYDVSEDDRRFRAAMTAAAGDAALAGQYFDELRKNYPERREFSCYQITNSPQLNQQLQNWLGASGFVLAAN
ncbi:4-phosphoerythronate dehydrogenase [Dasania sp. GY-MA-18]|uniref:Erythronate-4-phosphate dehydrogenase n=1 Tax=Dasania phycosphaerae TaxID=2950436 RepID=A0A9J6RQI0_9GAMM|nr:MULTISPECIES: 4-phosphoerythronate dehydrogenase [Dasania]MCR8924305.1 4-phosphoerythronate dehydrogenase [Dasania sp. GY-MA-18]MCZ0866958.1 4-phosphoerythronate dehydrogenase [Dasania phycosphaerae]MCZ0870462.1 4-phosphoerythronate dehydrogenase [Dasania phycosphaerae]